MMKGALSGRPVVLDFMPLIRFLRMQRRLHASLPEIRQRAGKGIANNLGEQFFPVFLFNASLHASGIVDELSNE